VVLRNIISSSVTKSGDHISWPVVNADLRKCLQSLERLVPGLQRQFDNKVYFEAIEQTDGQRVETLLLAIFDRRELPIDSDLGQETLKILQQAAEVLQKIAESPLSPELIAICAGEPTDSTATEIRAPEKIAAIANMYRKNLPESGFYLGQETETETEKMVLPHRGCTVQLTDTEELSLICEIKRVCDHTRTALVQQEDRKRTELKLPYDFDIRVKLLNAQLNQDTIEVLINPTYRIVNGIRKLEGGSITTFIKTVDCPQQGQLSV
tara:strand:- start:1540 stop:2337 length:798 start_codon:yes stop_codon:yes gene_type:complete